MAEAKSVLAEDLTSLWDLASLSADDFDALCAQISEAQPTPRLRVLCDAVAQEHQPSIRALARLAAILHPDEQELRDLFTEHLEEITELPPDSIPSEHLTLVVDRLLQLLNSRLIQLYVSAKDMRNAHESTFINAKIVTDLRPILSENTEASTQEIIAVLRRHHLTLTTIGDTNDRHKHYFVLDDEDLWYLADVIRTTIERISTLEQLAEKNDLADLSLR